MSRLNWGCAFDKYDGWIGSDRDDYGQEHVGDILDGLPWEDGFFDVVVSHHAMQIIKYVDVPVAIQELHRVLKPEGVLRFSVPDPRAAFRAWENHDHDWFPVADDVQPSIDGKLTAYLTWYSEARVCWTPGYAFHVLTPHFRHVAITKYGESLFGDDEITALDKRPNESLFVEALK